MYYLFDGTYAGFLTCMFESFERKEPNVSPVVEGTHLSELFRPVRTINTDDTKARRVHAGLRKKLDNDRAMDFFRVFLSENPKAYAASFRIILHIFTKDTGILENFGDPDMLYFSQTLKKVNRERHRMKAFVRFQKSRDGLYFSVVEPDFNVLPLIARFFKERYADQHWLIYDARRQYGLLYDQQTVSEVQLTHHEKDTLPGGTVAAALDEKEAQFQQLWKQYFKSTNIESRKNMKLHLQHVPKRYWKYLTEKW